MDGERRSFLQDQASSDIPDLARQCFAWFGGTTTTLAGYLLYKAMLMGGDTEKLLLRTMFIGDILYIGNFAYWVHYGLGYWTTGSMFNLIYGLLLPLCRAIVLYSEPFEESSREIDLDPDELLDKDKDKDK